MRRISSSMGKNSSNASPQHNPGPYRTSLLITGGQASELCRRQTLMFGVLWSALDVNPDGKRIAFDCFEYRHEVWAMANFIPTMPLAKDE